MSEWRVETGDCVELMAQMDEASVDAIVTDPPYGLGFMGKAWDDLPPGPEFAAQAFRVLKPGGHLLAFGGTRTYHRLAVAVEDAGFEIRDSLLWLYGSGFPKSRNLDGEYEGWGTALKPSYEPIVCARKQPDGTVAANMLAYGVGAMNIDACRIGWGAEGDKSAERKAAGYSEAAKKALGGVVASESDTGFSGEVAGADSTKGRWPANVTLSHTDDCRLLGTTEERRELRVSHADDTEGKNTYGSGGPGGGSHSEGSVPELVGVWECAPDCPVAAVNEASGIRPGGGYPAQRGANSVFNPTSGGSDGPRSMGDTGGAARFFYTGKTSPAERNAGLADLPPREGHRTQGAGRLPLLRCPEHDEPIPSGYRGYRCGCPKAWDENEDGMPKAVPNDHPTVKPIDLMRWLCRLVTPPGGLILDPFLGSGSTGCAAVIEDFDFVGFEFDLAYLPIAYHRIKHWQGYKGVPTDRALESAAREAVHKEAGQIGLLD